MDKKTMLEEVYEERLREFQEMDVDDENYGKAAEAVAKLASQVVEQKREKNDRKARWFKDGADVAIKAATLITTVAATIVCLRFEETGSITTTVGRKWADKILKG